MTNGHDVDEFLDDLRNAVNVQPSPGFEARVRVRVATEVPGRRWWWLGAAAAVAAAAVLVVMPMLKSGGVGRLKPFQAVQVDRMIILCLVAQSQSVAAALHQCRQRRAWAGRVGRGVARKHLPVDRPEPIGHITAEAARGRGVTFG